jgi:hypothetical protein
LVPSISPPSSPIVLSNPLTNPLSNPLSHQSPLSVLFNPFPLFSPCSPLFSHSTMGQNSPHVNDERPAAASPPTSPGTAQVEVVYVNKLTAMNSGNPRVCNDCKVKIANKEMPIPSGIRPDVHHIKKSKSASTSNSSTPSASPNHPATAAATVSTSSARPNSTNPNNPDAINQHNDTNCEADANTTTTAQQHAATNDNTTTNTTGTAANTIPPPSSPPPHHRDSAPAHPIIAPAPNATTTASPTHSTSAPAAAATATASDGMPAGHTTTLSAENVPELMRRHKREKKVRTNYRE